MASLRVPAHLQEVARALGLRSWVDSRKFAKDVHFESIEIFRERLRRHAEGGEAELSADLVVPMIAKALDVEGRLLTHVLDAKTYPIDDEATWQKICNAAAWVVLQAYERERGSGKEQTS